MAFNFSIALSPFIFDSDSLMEKFMCEARKSLIPLLKEG